MRIQRVHFLVHVKPDMNAKNLSAFRLIHVALVSITVTKRLLVQTLMMDFTAHAQKDLLELIFSLPPTLLSCRLEYLLRLAVTSLTFVLAATVPYLDLFISLLGALVMATLELIFPVMVDTAVSWPDITWTSRLKVT